ncbi:hypothetical protein HXX76_006890 [Chlamydomonas incerta]|uniref:Uncharacterized protein n=1 Tax=Chlamydomonas incerta TaxID=51695 RepID=A0A835T1N2_CHLIN|nr:hypothetical protein HXX76_006890 [Chlamydomonas incerta]|eukprot:KAG2435691.1 hypothetical protein HXX76_006890 [Chlamydomonas incerta]
MSCRLSLGRAQVKRFKTTLLSLNKIGGELLIEAAPQQLVLRSINTAKSAFLSVTYYSHFFENYELFDTPVLQTVALSKDVLAMFRSMKIASIDILLDLATAKLTATVHTEEGLVKRYSFNCVEGEVLQATVDSEAYPTTVVAEAAELDKLLSSFSATVDEITLIVHPMSAAAAANGHKACEMRSYIDPLKAGQESALQTSLTMDTRSVFTSYCHNSEHPADATFNVKGADVALRMETAGAPVVVEPHFRGLREGGETDFTAMLVLATVPETMLGPEHAAMVAQMAEHRAQEAAGATTGMGAGRSGGGGVHGGEEDGMDEDDYGAVAHAGARGDGGDFDMAAHEGAYGAARPAAAPQAAAAAVGGQGGRRRLPGAAGASQPAAARDAYAAAAAAAGMQAPAQTESMDDDVPARRTGRQAAAAGGAAGAAFIGVQGALGGARTQLPPPPAPYRPTPDPTGLQQHLQFMPGGAAEDAGTTTATTTISAGGGVSGGWQQPLQHQDPADPRRGPGSHHHQQQPTPGQQPESFGFARGGLGEPSHTGGGAQAGHDSQDPESLPGMRSPYWPQGRGRSQLGDAPPPAAGFQQRAHPHPVQQQQQAGAGPMWTDGPSNNTSAGGRGGSAQGGQPPSNVTAAAGQAAPNRSGLGCPGTWGSGAGGVTPEGANDAQTAGACGANAGAGGVGSRGAGASSWGAGGAAAYGGTLQPRPGATAPGVHTWGMEAGGGGPLPQGETSADVGISGALQQHQPQHQHQPPRQAVIHAELFGDDDEEDDDEEVPATPPEQQETRSMGHGVLGMGAPDAG